MGKQSKMKTNTTINLFRSLVLLMAFGFTTISLSAQIQLGGDIDGEASYDYSGRAVSLSSDGSRVAIGASLNDGTDTSSGQVRVYELSSGSWSQLGGDIDGDLKRDNLGFRVELSADGSTLVTSANFSDDFATDAGEIKIYRYSSGSWSQLGSDIYGVSSFDEFGYSVGISGDGNTVVAGALYNDDLAFAGGHVRVFVYSAGAWTQLGSTIAGGSANDHIGVRSLLSDDGRTLAVGALCIENGSMVDVGGVLVYDYNTVLSDWVQRGDTIFGEDVGDYASHSLDLSSDGNKIILGTSNNDDGGVNAGQSQVYHYVSGAWTQIGGDIEGTVAGDRMASSVTISDDGLTIAMGAHFADSGTQSNTGLTEVHKYSSSESRWIRYCSGIYGENPWDYSGDCIDMSSSGDTLAIGLPDNDGGGTNSGSVRVYVLDPCVLPVELQSFEGTSIKEGIRLDWKTASELNNAGFEVQRSIDGRTYETLAFVNGHGNSSQEIDYNYLDRSAPNGKIFYRLKQIDFNGDFEFSETIMIEHGGAVSISISPNPAKDHVWISGIEKGMVSIYNVTGSIVFQSSVTSKISLENLQTGVYFIQVSNEFQSQSLKLLIER